MNNTYRFQLEKYRGRSTRHVCPQCGRKQVFTRYIDTENGNRYLADKVGKCNRLDKCGYHYTPRQYFEDNPWLREEHHAYERHTERRERREQRHQPQPQPTPEKRVMELPRWLMENTMGKASDYRTWLESEFGAERTAEICRRYHIGGVEGYVIFWQVDIEGRVRTGKLMAYDPFTGKRLKESGAVDWIHAMMRREGTLPEEWELTQCLYGEDLLAERPKAVVAVAEGAKTAHIGAMLMPEMVWVATDSMMGLSAERLQVLKGRKVILFPDEGKGYEEWKERIVAIAEEVGFDYTISDFVEQSFPKAGDDFVDILTRVDEDECPF